MGSIESSTALPINPFQTTYSAGGSQRGSVLRQGGREPHTHDETQCLVIDLLGEIWVCKLPVFKLTL